jgi:tryptophan-specific transport protein
MIMMTFSGWMLLEALRNYDRRASFSTATKELLGQKFNWFNNLTVYFVGGILLYAYITSSGLIIDNLLHLGSQVASVLFVAIFSAFVWHSTRAVDRISVVLILFMVLSFIFGISGLASHVSVATLFDQLNEQGHYAPYAMAMLPVALTSFGYHHSVASLRAYYGNETRAKWAILGGTVIALALYTLWMVSIFGNLPRDQFAGVIEQGGNVDVLLNALGNVIESESVASAINTFSMAAILSSFIGVGLGVFDYLADLMGFDNSRKGRSKTWLVTFIPPLVLSLLFPFGFVIAIGYAGAAATVWACITPALLVRKSRKLSQGSEPHLAPGGNIAIAAVILFGIATAVFHFLSLAELLPLFKG